MIIDKWSIIFISQDLLDQLQSEIREMTVFLNTISSHILDQSKKIQPKQWWNFPFISEFLWHQNFGLKTRLETYLAMYSAVNILWYVFFIVNSDIFLIHARQGLISSLYNQANFIQFRVTCQSLYKNCALSCFYYFDDMYALTNPCWTASFLLIWYKIARIINFPSGKVFARKRPMLSTALRCSLWTLS